MATQTEQGTRNGAWRILRKGEMVSPGDQYRLRNGDWEPSSASGYILGSNESQDATYRHWDDAT